MDNGERYRRFLDGDDDALADLVDAYYDSLTMYLNAYVHDLSTAEELAEDTFFRLVTKKPRFLGKSSFKTWLYAIGRNLAIDRLRRLRAHPSVPLDEADDLAGREPEWFRQEDRIVLYHAMHALKPEYRQALWLTYFEDLSAKEVAAVMRRSVSSVEHLIGRARRLLKSELEKEGLI